MIIRFILLLFLIPVVASDVYSDDEIPSNSKSPTLVKDTLKKGNYSIPSHDENMRKIFLQHQIENEGYNLARRGLYEEALLKYKQSMNPVVFDEQWDKGMGRAYIKIIYERQGKFEEALKILDEYPRNEYSDRERSELRALIKARDTKTSKPIYDYLSYLKSKYKKYLPPDGYAAGFSNGVINDLIHLYDYMRDYDSGIAFIDEVIKYHAQHKDKNHRSAHAKDVREYTRVKEAWELDKKTGQHGHLQEVIKTSDVIGW